MVTYVRFDILNSILLHVYKANFKQISFVIVIESFLRIGRSTKDLIELVEYFEKKGVKLISFDTTTPTGKLMLTVFQAFSRLFIGT